MCRYMVEAMAAPNAPNEGALQTPQQPLVAQSYPELMPQQQQETNDVGNMQPPPFDLQAFLQQCNLGGLQVIQIMHQDQQSPLSAGSDVAPSSPVAATETVARGTQSQGGRAEGKENVPVHEACSNSYIDMMDDEIDAAIGWVESYREQHMDLEKQARMGELEQQTPQEEEQARLQLDQLEEVGKRAAQQLEANQQLSPSRLCSSSNGGHTLVQGKQEETPSKKRRRPGPASVMKKRHIGLMYD